VYRTLIGRKAAPIEALEDVGFRPFHIAVLVGIFDTHNEIALEFLCEEIII
jgi:hypothetical protein